MERTFTIEISISEIFTTGEIWPNGDGPEHPTADDVRAVFLRNPAIAETCQEWGLEIRREDVRVIDHGPAGFARWVEARREEARRS